MSSPTRTDEDEEEEVQFVSEGRPVLECVDLLSDSDDEGCSSFTGDIQDEITCHKARVTSTLDRLAQQVALEKKKRADKCRAFKERQVSQRAHGQRELAVSSAHGSNQEAKRCVDMWLKMPGPQPGMMGSGFRRRLSAPSFSRSNSTQTCPVINCGRVYENKSLLDGHLKRFDHSPCDPTITLKGSPSEYFACVACAQYFQTKDAWRKHVESKVSSSAADGHSLNQNPQRIVCFACPACYSLFNLRDECLQHMSAKNHFTESLAMNETKGRAQPVPIPQYVKNRLVALCKDSTFNVRCSLCHKVLVSHQAAQAHFNVYCRQGCAVAKADKTIVKVMEELRVRGQCSVCRKTFLSRAEIDRHEESTQHDVEVNRTMGKALLQHCRFNVSRDTERPETPSRQQSKKRSGPDESPAKRKRLNPSRDDGSSTSGNSVTAWFCECGLRFFDESTASKHLLAANQIFHQCGVCGKHMGELSITRLHMSRFHGGAHLSNYLFFCRKCRVEMPRQQDILSHVSDTHSGHNFYSEQEVPEELAKALDVKPSKCVIQQDTEIAASSSSSSSPSKAEPTWMCRMCEDTFDSEREVREHCGDADAHSFQRFACGHCPQKFFKESTVRRHCTNEHNGDIKSSHFCGLCDSMPFDSKKEFSEHYASIHARDYYCVGKSEEVVQQPDVATGRGTSRPTCECMGSEKCKGDMKATYTKCMKDLSAEGKCRYVCDPCEVSLSSYAQMKTHVHTKHPALHLDKTFDVECEVCQESFNGVPSFHKHYHARHCALEPCCFRSKKGGKDALEKGATRKNVKMLDAVEIKPDVDEIEDETLVKVLNMDEANEDSEAQESEGDDKMSVNAEEEEDRESADIEEALKRSLLEF